MSETSESVSYTHLRAHETGRQICIEDKTCVKSQHDGEGMRNKVDVDDRQHQLQHLFTHQLPVHVKPIHSLQV